MLEPLYTCNLACIGCSTERYTGKLSDRLPLETCFKAAEDCGAPIVNICGGEPTLYPELKDLVAGMIARKKYMIMCTNALRLEDKVYGVIPPTDHLFLMVHLDGMRETHDHVTNRKGVFDKAVAMVRKGKELGYHVFLNTTVFKQTNVEEIEELCRLVDELKANGILVSPGYEYESVERDIFLTKAQIHEKFRAIRTLSRKYKVLRDADVSGVRRGPARADVLAVVDCELHAQRLEGTLLFDRGRGLPPRLERVLDQDGLGILGEPAGPPVSELQDAQRFRAQRGQRVNEDASAALCASPRGRWRGNAQLLVITAWHRVGEVAVKAASAAENSIL